MESIPLEMDNIFDDYDDDDAIPRRLPDLDEMEADLEPMIDRQEEDGQNDGGNDEDVMGTDNPELLAKLKSMKGASKNIVRRTIPKLDATRLTGDRGIPVIPSIFKDVPLKGKHHEVEDLKVIMHHLEHWAHRLFPKMPFLEVLDRAERLGAKKEVQTCVKRIRLGMQILPTDAVESDDDDDVQRIGDASPDKNPPIGPDEDEIESLIQEQEEAERQFSQSQPLPAPDIIGKALPSQSQDKSSTETLSDDVKTRIERNKRLAMEKRAARLGKTPIQDPILQESSQHSLNEPSLETSTEINLLGAPSPQDGQTFDSAIELLEAEDDLIENPPMEQDMDTERVSLPEDIGHFKQEEIAPVPEENNDYSKPASQESDEEFALSFPDTTNSPVINESHDT